MPKLVGHESGVTQEIEIPVTGAVLGRQRGCDVVLRSKEVSRQHARLSLRQGVPYVEDLGSANGTMVNGALINGIQELRTGDTVMFGELEFHVVDEPAASEPSPRSNGKRGEKNLAPVAPHFRVNRPDDPAPGKDSRDRTKPVPATSEKPTATPERSLPTPQQPSTEVSRQNPPEKLEPSHTYAKPICAGLMVLVLISGFVIGRAARAMGTVVLPGELAATQNLKYRAPEPAPVVAPVAEESPTGSGGAKPSTKATSETGEEPAPASKPTVDPVSAPGVAVISALPEPDSDPSGPQEAMSMTDSAKAIKLMKELQKLRVDMSDTDAVMKVATKNLGMPPAQARRVMGFVTGMANRKKMMDGGVDSILKDTPPKPKPSESNPPEPEPTGSETSNASQPTANEGAQSGAKPAETQGSSSKTVKSPTAVQTPAQSQPPAETEPAPPPVRLVVNRGPGYYINIWGLAVVFSLVLAWRASVQWIGKDCLAFGFDQAVWLQAAGVGGLTGPLMAFFCPDLSWGILLNSACMAGPLLAYVAYRDERVPESSRVLRLPDSGGSPDLDREDVREQNELSNLAGLGCHRKMQGELREAISKRNGLIVVCGPAGAGKSTTLRAVVSELEPALGKIITIENPIKFQIPGVDQYEINWKAGLNYVVAWRKVQWQQPQVVMLEEIPNNETALLTCQSASAEQLVLSIVPANDPWTAFQRLLDLGIDPGLLADSLSAVVGQRLIRRLCAQCKEQYHPDAELLRRYRIPHDHEAVFFRPPSGQSTCPACEGTGYRGRVAIFEMLVVDSSIKTMIRERATPAEIRTAARRRGMTTLRENGFRTAIRGSTSLEEVINAASES